jgi:thioredoxin-related protein
MPSYLYAQVDSGIVFKKDFFWTELLKKAKSENKLVFVDCYTTWCGPCKRMDREVFITREVGDYFNKNFICAKLQMDQTTKDDEATKRNYDLVEKVAKKYKVNSYPSFLFISPDGRLVHRASGYTSGKQFIEMAVMINKPGYTYMDPYQKYDSLIRLYRDGKKCYKEMPYMIKTANEFGSDQLNDSLRKDFYSYLKTLKKKALLSKTNIEFLSRNITKIKDPFVKIFSKYESEINAIMKDSVYARMALDSIIFRSVTDSVLNRFYQVVSFDSAKNKRAEPSWSSIYKIVNASFDHTYAERAVRAAKVYYFRSIDEYGKVAKLVDSQIKQKDLNLSDIMVKTWINSDAWRIFLSDQDKETIELALSWMKVIVDEVSAPLPNWIDTYANLLYKASRLGYINKLTEAIETEKKAADSAERLSIASKDDFWKSKADVYLDTQKKMQQGKITWTK